uniref:Uncharacterized protein n=1 Tax=Oryza brachyantha TaxID=4533 RepID=J3M633_ORYBR
MERGLAVHPSLGLGAQLIAADIYVETAIETVGVLGGEDGHMKNHPCPCSTPGGGGGVHGWRGQAIAPVGSTMGSLSLLGWLHRCMH